MKSDDLIRRTIAIIHRMLDGEDRAILRPIAQALLAEHVEFQRAFTLANGPNVSCPTNRAWYLLNECLEHATLLR